MKAWTRFLIPSMADTLFLSVFLLLALGYGHGLLGDGDTGYHIRAGDFIFGHNIIPTHDIFSFWNPPLPWTAHEWLSEVIMAWVHTAAGLTGVVIFFSLTIASTYVLLFKMMRQTSSDIVLTILIATLAAISSALHWLARPHIFTLTLMVIWYALLDNFQYRDKNRLFILPLLMLLWVNLHGGYILGIILIGIYLVGNTASGLTSRQVLRELSFGKAKALFLAMIACLAVAMLNPQGYHILVFPFRLASDTFIMNNVQEFLSPNFHKPLPFKYLLLLLIAALAFSRISLNWIEAGLVLLFTYMALYSARYIPLFSIITAPILLRLIERKKAELPGIVARFFDHRAKNMESIDRLTKGNLWSIVGLLAVISLAASGYVRFEFNEKIFPVSGVEFLKREKIDGNMFNDDEFGDYIIYTLWPRYKVFMDGRSDMYGANIGKEYLNVARVLPGWEETIKKYEVTWVFYHTASALSAILREHTEWHIIYSDAVATIFVKKDERNQHLIHKYPHVSLSEEQPKKTAGKAR